MSSLLDAQMDRLGFFLITLTHLVSKCDHSPSALPSLSDCGEFPYPKRTSYFFPDSESFDSVTLLLRTIGSLARQCERFHSLLRYLIAFLPSETDSSYLSSSSNSLRYSHPQSSPHVKKPQNPPSPLWITASVCFIIAEIIRGAFRQRGVSHHSSSSPALSKGFSTPFLVCFLLN
jgi:hypothetical protein